MNYGFTVKKPTHGRRTFAIHKKIYQKVGKPLQPQIKDERLNSINSNFLAGLLTEEQALIQVKLLVDTLRREAGLSQEKAHIRDQILKANYKTFEKLWERDYIGRDIVSPETAEREFLVAMKGIDPLPLASASKLELQKKVDAAWDSTGHKRYTTRVNSLLKFLGRPFILHRKKRPHKEVKFVTFEELQKILNHVESPELKALYITLFGTGMRLGEAFMIDSDSLKKNGSIYVSQQMDKNLKIRGLKNSKNHHTVLLDICKKGFEEWAAVEDKEEWRKCCQHPLINAARKSFKLAKKQISPHSLRHSYCIHLLGKGVPLDRVAKLIGDSIKTTEEYYAGYDMTTDEVSVVQKIIGQ
ncbi:MAG: tyrosine-type recombinase/integrase [Bdellovibrionaceae bacterium]|nr:tyrosine-type recombinase/integrase [Pseudobdellovibrionaceae bacterium]